MNLQELVSILKTSFDAGILINESGNIHFLNTAAQDLLGATNDSFQNLGMDEALVFLNKETNTPVLWKEVKDSLNESMTLIVKSKDGRDTVSGEGRQTEIGEYTFALYSSLVLQQLGSQHGGSFVGSSLYYIIRWNHSNGKFSSLSSLSVHERRICRKQHFHYCRRHS